METSNIPLQEIKNDLTTKHKVRLFVLRLDLNHPHISGNKLFKLKYNLEEAKKEGKDTLLTFGGAYSNHIAATAAAGKEYGFKTIGIIRGEEVLPLNPTLQFANDCGMQLLFVSREDYKNKTSDSLPNYYIIPEGGANELGVKGCTEIVNHIPIPFDYICCACGTGTTLTGIVLSLKENQQALGFQVLKGESYITNEVTNWLKMFTAEAQRRKEKVKEEEEWTINEKYHFGGYAKVNDALKTFVNNFKVENNIPLDYIYTGKMMFGIVDLIQKGFFQENQTIVAVHTGGLQGNVGFK